MNTTFLLTLAPYLIPLAMPFGVALAASLYMSLVQHLPMQQRLIVSSLAHTVVTAVEQMALPEVSGMQKKDQALHALVSILDGIGIQVPAPLLEMALESAVFELHTLYPHRDDAAPTTPAGPFPYRPTLRSIPTVQTSSSYPDAASKETQP